MEQIFTGFSIKVGLGVVGAVIANALGGWSTAMQTLLVFMVIDYASGLAVALFYQGSNKTETGGFSSTAGLKGLMKKAFMLMGVWMAHQVDVVSGLDYIRTAYIIMLCVNEFGSIGENFGIMGVPMPEYVTEAFEVLQNRNKTDDQ
ncbi:MAG: phage holin family protein [Sphaerochaetaceae bacterium]